MKVIVEIELRAYEGGWYAKTATSTDETFCGKGADEATAKALRHIAAKTLGEEDLGQAVEHWKGLCERADALAVQRHQEMRAAQDRERKLQSENALLKERLTTLAVAP